MAAIILCGISFQFASYGADPKDPTPTPTPTPSPSITATPTPTPTATPCCPSGSHAVASVTWRDPKTGQVIEAGYMTDVHMYHNQQLVDNQTLYFGIPCTPPFVTDFSASGGSDSDVCVDDDTNKPVKTYGVANYYIWSGAPGTVEGYNNNIFHFTPPVPEEGTILSYTLNAESEDYGPCNVDDPNKSARVYLKCYFPFKIGADPEGNLSPKPEGIWSSTPTYRWDDQLLSKGTATMGFGAQNVNDMDDYENDPPPIAWDDGPVNDTPGQSDIRWESSKPEQKFGTNVSLTIPQGGIVSAVIWTIKLHIDDDEDPCMADDAEKLVDQAQYRVYREHLARDSKNEGDLNTKNNGEPIQPSGACRGAAQHAYNGQTNPANVPPWGSGSWRVIYEIDEKEEVVIPLITTGLNRRDVFVFNWGSHTNTCISGTTIWEYNGRLNPARWGTAELEDYIEIEDSGRKLVRIIEQYYCPDND